MIATQKLTKKTELKPCGTSQSKANAASGPSIAPVVSIAPSAVKAPPTSISSGLQTAERPYPKAATSLWRRKRSETSPLATRTSAAPPW